MKRFQPRHPVYRQHDRLTALAVIFGAVACGMLVSAPVKIMPLGDSITDGSHRNMYPGAYRIALWRLCENAGVEIDFVGSNQCGPAELPDKDHEGHTGVWSNLTKKNTSETVDINLEEKLDQFHPDIVLVLFGANDVIHGSPEDAEKVPGNIGTLVDLIRGRLPDAAIVVGTLTPIDVPAMESEITMINSELPGVVADKAGEGIDVSLCDLHAGMTVEDLQDGVHPDSTGYRKMADTWFATIKPLIEDPTGSRRHVLRYSGSTETACVLRRKSKYLTNGRSVRRCGYSSLGSGVVLMRLGVEGMRPRSGTQMRLKTLLGTVGASKSE